MALRPSGRMRLVLGDQDLVLGVGEAAEFDTQVPHWFGSTGDGPAEVLSIFGRSGERMHLHEQQPDTAPAPASRSIQQAPHEAKERGRSSRPALR